MKSDAPGFAFTKMTVADDGLLAAKKITRSPDGREDVEPYGRAKWWWMQPATANTLEAMAAELRAMADEPRSCIVAGAVLPHIDCTAPQLRRAAESRPLVERTLHAVPRSWIALDFDDVQVPAPLGEGEHLAVAGVFVRDHVLPPAFHGMRMICAATASTGRKGPTAARLRLFCLLSEAYPLDALRGWMKGAQTVGLGIDPATALAAQPIYTARPVFVGLTDPVPRSQRVTILAGSAGERVTLNVHQYAAELVRVETAIASARATLGSDDWRGFMLATVGRDAGFFGPLSAGLGVAARSTEHPEDVAAFVAALLAERADKARQKQYGAAWVLKALHRFRRADTDTAARAAAAKARLLTALEKKND